jgi:hypothetical protein
VLLAVLAAAAVLVLGSRDPFWSGDWMDEAWPAYHALAVGSFGDLLARAPAYGSFIALIGAPATWLVAHVASGVAAGQHLSAIFALTALPGAIALACLGGLLGARARADGAPRQVWALVVLLAAGSPLAYQALMYGHPEDALAAPLSVLGVLAARRGRPVLAGLLLAVAIASKQWAVLAVLPAMLAGERRGLRVAMVAGAGAALLIAPLMAFTPQVTGSGSALVTSGALFHPQQIWWPFGVPADRAFIAGGHGTTMAPAWLMPVTHPLIVLLALPLSGLWWLRAGRGVRDRDGAFALLALLFAERCLLDPWNLVYYELPLVLALLAWEVSRRRPLPVLALLTTAATWLSFVTYSAHTGDGPFLAYIAWMLPLIGWLGWSLYGPARVPRPAVLADRLRAAPSVP